MTKTREQIYQDIGSGSLAMVEELAGRLLVYAEVEQGVISADLFYMHSSGLVKYQPCSKPVRDDIYSLWELSKQTSVDGEWRVMCYVIDEGKFAIDLAYPSQLLSDEELSDRRPRALEKYFGDKKVDYSRV